MRLPSTFIAALLATHASAAALPQGAPSTRDLDATLIAGPTFLRELAGTHLWQSHVSPGAISSLGVVAPVVSTMQFTAKLDDLADGVLHMHTEKEATKERRELRVLFAEVISVEPLLSEEQVSPVLPPPTAEPSTLDDAAKIANAFGDRVTLNFPSGATLHLLRGARVRVTLREEYRLYVVDGLNRLHSFDSATGRSLWVSDFLDSDDPALSVHETQLGTTRAVFEVSTEGILLLNGETGDFIKRSRVDFFPGTPAVAYGATLIYGNDSGRICWEQMATCVPWWNSGLPGRITGTPVIMGRLVAAAGSKGRVGAWDAESSATHWMWNASAGIEGAISASLVPAGSSSGLHYEVWTLFVASLDQSVYGIDGSSGRQRWKYFTQSPITSDTVAIGDRVYVQIPGEGLVALRADGGGRPDGQVVWRSPVRGDAVCLFSNRLVCFDESTGMVSLLEPLDGSVISSTPLDLASITATDPMNGDLYLVARDGRVQRIRPQFRGSPSAGIAGAAGSSP
ncbi:MAG: PQQ-binding-like beta-propeller repeat protein [Planctomycetota bacterium]|nr:PQQ-binding-like beta-propeller repeat protein [Planctomycetota bacterium]MDA1105191.1 PQQ-binding-like beta-propeller repeat protein [Planctomycetota bacterium]